MPLLLLQLINTQPRIKNSWAGPDVCWIKNLKLKRSLQLFWFMLKVSDLQAMPV